MLHTRSTPNQAPAPDRRLRFPLGTLVSRCLLAAALGASLTVSAPAAETQPPDPLARGFAQPPDSTKPWCYWYWISDNISKEGITRDLEAMRRAGIGEAFIGNIFLKEVPAGKIKVLSPQWWELVEHAIREGGRLGVNVGLFNCPGWSQSGGPWIKPGQTMRFLVSSEVRASGPRHFEQKLPTPREPFQDVAVQAFPAPAHDADSLAALAPRFTCTPRAAGTDKLADGSLQTVFPFPAGAGQGKTPFTIELELPQPLTARSLSLVPGETAWAAQVELLAAAQDGRFRPVRSFKFDRSNMALAVGPMPRGPVEISLAPVAARRFRLAFSGVTGKAALAQINLSPAARVESFVEKQLGKMHPTPQPMWGTYLWPAQPEPGAPGLTIPPQGVIDLSGHLSADATLRWDVPPGNWVILRSGMTPTGMKNSPASPEGQGLEVDKMNRAAAQAHFEAFIGQVLKRLPARERTAFKRVVADSYEMGPENWTDGFAETFRRRYHYDPLPWLPVLSGRVVGSKEQSDRFLWDLRRLVADHVATDYVGGLREACHKHGLQLWLENYGHWGFPSEFLKYGGNSDLIGGEYWVSGDLGSIELRAASSCANTYGKPRVSAESFTGGPPFQSVPASLKARGDWSFCQGVNHVVLHVYIEQPWKERAPGINAPFGTEFNRLNTWFEPGRAWIDYLRRSCFLLQQGWRVADVAYFIGEDAPKMTGVQRPELPPGRDFDYINADIIERKLSVKDGLLTLPHGTTYRVLVLPELETMRPELLGKIRALAEAGATVVGPPPLRSPSLENYPQCDQEVRRLAAQLWGAEALHLRAARSSVTNWLHTLGKGRVLWGVGLEKALEDMGVGPDFQSEIPLLYTHRASGGTQLYFVANPEDREVVTTASFRAPGLAPELWHPDTGRIERAGVYDQARGMMRVPLQLGPHGSVFVVFRHPAESNRLVSVARDGRKLPDPAQPLQLSRNAHGSLRAVAWESGRYTLTAANGHTRTLTVPALPASVPLSGPWEVQFTPGMGEPEQATFDQLTDWTRRPEEGIRHYSGKAVYRKTFDLPDSLAHGSGCAILLDLGQVHDLATVRLNGRSLPTLWLAPWRLDVTSALRPGKNLLEIEVVNAWNNRLVGDKGLPTAQRHTFLALDTIPQNAPLLPAGLLGPVTLRPVRVLTVGIGD